MSDTVLQGLIETLYAAAFEPSEWAQVGALLAKVMDAQTSIIWTVDGGVARDWIRHNLPVSTATLYPQYHHAVDPGVGMIQHPPRLAACLRPEVMLEALGSRFHINFGAQPGICQIISARVPIDSSVDMAIGIGIHRPYDARPFTEADRQRLDGILPHVQRAAQLKRRLHTLERRAQTGFAVLEALLFGVVVASGDSDIVFANPAAERLARQNTGLVLSRHGYGLSAAKPAEAHRLRRLVRNAARGGAGGAMYLTRPSLVVLVSPLPIALSADFGAAAKLALVLIKDTVDDTPLTGELLSVLYGLTGAEAQVAQALASGRSTEQIAQTRSVSPLTVRVQIRRVLGKTGALSLRDLVRRLSSLPAIRRGGECGEE